MGKRDCQSGETSSQGGVRDKMHANMMRRLLVLVIAMIAWMGLSEVALAQQEDEEKSIKAEVFIKDRAASSKTSRPARKYKPGPKMAAGINSSPPPGTSFVEVGVTFWRFSAAPGDKAKRLEE